MANQQDGKDGAKDRDSRRHATRARTGSNEPKHGERKEQRGFVPRQGGDQTRGASKAQKEEER
jgi:hypothetical protein